MKQTNVMMIAMIAMGILILSFSQPKKPWVVPAEAAGVVNPIKGIGEGKSLWSTHCASCHGKSGKGDGTKSAQLDTEPGNLLLTIPKQSDGSLYYKTSVGRGDMPSFKKKMSSDDVWSVVNYMKTLK